MLSKAYLNELNKNEIVKNFAASLISLKPPHLDEVVISGRDIIKHMTDNGLFDLIEKRSMDALLKRLV